MKDTTDTQTVTIPITGGHSPSEDSVLTLRTAKGYLQLSLLL